ncbi:MAG: VWA domain-containing protein [Desulfobacterales bacterium]|nr:VWA domain-containing protein [Desulfobacterales bacterium]
MRIKKIYFEVIFTLFIFLTVSCISWAVPTDNSIPNPEVVAKTTNKVDDESDQYIFEEDFSTYGPLWYVISEDNTIVYNDPDLKLKRENFSLKFGDVVFCVMKEGEKDTISIRIGNIDFDKGKVSEIYGWINRDKLISAKQALTIKKGLEKGININIYKENQMRGSFSNTNYLILRCVSIPEKRVQPGKKVGEKGEHSILSFVWYYIYDIRKHIGHDGNVKLYYLIGNSSSLGYAFDIKELDFPRERLKGWVADDDVKIWPTPFVLELNTEEKAVRERYNDGNDFKPAIVYSEPNYFLSCFTLTEPILKKLKDPIPEPIINKMRNLINQKFVIKHDFIDALKKEIGSEEMDKYSAQILEEAFFSGTISTEYVDAWKEAINNTIITSIDKRFDPYGLGVDYSRLHVMQRINDISDSSNPWYQVASIGDVTGKMPQSEVETFVFKLKQMYNELQGSDIVFLVDKTGSMIDEMQQVKKFMKKIVDAFHQANKINENRNLTKIRIQIPGSQDYIIFPVNLQTYFNLVCYEKNPELVFTQLDISKDYKKLDGYFNSIQYGGDTENLHTALIEVLKNPKIFRSNTHFRLIINITDEEPDDDRMNDVQDAMPKYSDTKIVKETLNMQTSDIDQKKELTTIYGLITDINTNYSDINPEIVLPIYTQKMGSFCKEIFHLKNFSKGTDQDEIIKIIESKYIEHNESIEKTLIHFQSIITECSDIKKELATMSALSKHGIALAAARVGFKSLEELKKSQNIAFLEGFTKIKDTPIRISESSIRNLVKDNVPKDIVDALMNIKNTSYQDEKTFFEKLEQTIGIDKATQYKVNILKHTEKGNQYPNYRIRIILKENDLIDLQKNAIDAAKNIEKALKFKELYEKQYNINRKKIMALLILQVIDGIVLNYERPEDDIKKEADIIIEECLQGSRTEILSERIKLSQSLPTDSNGLFAQSICEIIEKEPKWLYEQGKRLELIGQGLKRIQDSLVITEKPDDLRFMTEQNRKLTKKWFYQPPDSRHRYVYIPEGYIP